MAFSNHCYLLRPGIHLVHDRTTYIPASLQAILTRCLSRHLLETMKIFVVIEHSDCCSRRRNWSYCLAAKTTGDIRISMNDDATHSIFSRFSLDFRLDNVLQNGLIPDGEKMQRRRSCNCARTRTGCSTYSAARVDASPLHRFRPYPTNPKTIYSAGCFPSCIAFHASSWQIMYIIHSTYYVLLFVRWRSATDCDIEHTDACYCKCLHLVRGHGWRKWSSFTKSGRA